MQEQEISRPGLKIEIKQWILEIQEQKIKQYKREMAAYIIALIEEVIKRA